MNPVTPEKTETYIAWLLRQDLHDGLPRSEYEIAAIKATQRKPKRYREGTHEDAQG